MNYLYTFYHILQCSLSVHKVVLKSQVPNLGLKHSTDVIRNTMCSEGVDVKSGDPWDLFQGGYHCHLSTEKNGQEINKMSFVPPYLVHTRCYLNRKWYFICYLHVYFLWEDARMPRLDSVCYVWIAAFKNQGLLRTDLKVIAIILHWQETLANVYKYYWFALAFL